MNHLCVVPVALLATLLPCTHADSCKGVDDDVQLFQLSKAVVRRVNATVCQHMWSGTQVYGADDGNKCEMISLAPHWALGGGAPPNMCIRSYPDAVSDVLRLNKRWPDCTALALLWKKLGDAPAAGTSSSFAPCGGKGVKKLFVDAGANIGACTMQMLSRPDVDMVVSFEPNPKNLFYLTSSALQNRGISRKLALFPMGLGEADASHQMFMQPRNAGNTVLDVAVATNPVSDIQPVEAFTTTLDEVFFDERGMAPYIHLMKMDTQGFETHIMKGGRRLLASGAINAIHFELAPAWLHGEGTSPAELFSIMESSGYVLHHSEDGITEDSDLAPPLSHDDLVRIACTENNVAPRDFIAIFQPSWARQAHPPVTC